MAASANPESQILQPSNGPRLPQRNARSPPQNLGAHRSWSRWRRQPCRRPRPRPPAASRRRCRRCRACARGGRGRGGARAEPRSAAGRRVGVWGKRGGPACGADLVGEPPRTPSESAGGAGTRRDRAAVRPRGREAAAQCGRGAVRLRRRGAGAKGARPHRHAHQDRRGAGLEQPGHVLDSQRVDAVVHQLLSQVQVVIQVVLRMRDVMGLYKLCMRVVERVSVTERKCQAYVLGAFV